MDKELTKLQELQREIAYLLEIVKRDGRCKYCKNNPKYHDFTKCERWPCKYCNAEPCACHGCDRLNHWEWEGVRT